MHLEMVMNRPEYWEFIRKVRFHPSNLYGFVETEPVTEEQQKKYMEEHKEDYWICVADGSPAGFIGIVDRDLRIAVHPDYKRRGIGTYMVKQLLSEDFEQRFTVRVKLDNEVSLSFFKSIGFEPEFFLLSRKSD